MMREAAFGSGPSPQPHTSKLISYHTLLSSEESVFFSELHSLPGAYPNCT